MSATLAAAEEEAPPSLEMAYAPGVVGGGGSAAVTVSHTQVALRRGFFTELAWIQRALAAAVAVDLADTPVARNDAFPTSARGPVLTADPTPAPAVAPCARRSPPPRPPPFK